MGQAASAATPPTGNVNVIYNPQNTQTVQGDEPLHFTYPLTITAPGVLPVGNVAIAMTVTVISAPPGVTPAVAAGYVTFSVPTLNFTGPNQAITTTVQLDVPVAAAAVGDFTFKLSTTGWPAGRGIVDNGTLINMHVNPPSERNPPIVAITSPADGTVYQHIRGGPAVDVPVRVAGVASQSAPVTGLTAVLSGIDEDGVVIPDVPINLVLSSLGTPSAEGVTTLQISVPGTYTIFAVATNDIGSDVTSVDFIVEEQIPPPTVVIDPPQNNPQYTYVRGLTSVNVPFQYVGSTLGSTSVDGIVSLAATLALGGSGDPTPITPTAITPTGVGQFVVTASGSFKFGLGGVLVNGGAGGTMTNTINATATDVYSQVATDTEVFTVTELVPVITTTISTPQEGTTIPLPPDASPLSVPFAFTSAVDHGSDGATVTAISATLKKDADDAVGVAVTPANLNTPTATGTGTFQNVQPGNYIMVATGTNVALNLSASDTTNFTVTPPPPPVIVFTSPTPADGATINGLSGVPLTVPFAIRTSSTGTPAFPGPAYIRTQSVTMNAQPVTLAHDTASPAGTSFVTTGDGSLAIPAAGAGTYTYALDAVGTDAYGQIATTHTTFTVVITDPVIRVSIDPIPSPQTLPIGGSLTVPFTFRGDITAGATVDTLTGALGGVPVTITSYTGLGTAQAVGTGTMTITQAGTYTVTAHDTNTATGIYADAARDFVVVQAQSTPPLTITITQPPQPTYTLVGNCSSLSIPITFVGKSNNGNTGGKVSTMTATLDGKPVTLATLSGINTPTSTATATLSVNTAGTHVLVVKDTDPYNQLATASVTFNVVITNPAISINVNNPASNATFTLPCGGSSSNWGCGGYSSSPTLSIPFSFTSNITPGATIDSICATLNGCSISVTKSGIGTDTATGTGTISVNNAGTYTLTFTAKDYGCGGCNGSGSVVATKSVTFVVKKPGPPAVTITNPTQTSFTSYCLGCNGISIPFSFTGTSQCGNVSKLTATLDGQCVNVTTSGIGTGTATGSGTLAVKSAGSHKLTVTATDANGTTSSSTTFNLTVLTPTPSVTIAQPLANATFTYDYGATVPSVPFTFTAKTNSGATISSVKATLGSDCVNVTSTGIGTDTVTGSGTLKPNCAGTYTLNITAVSCGVSASSKVTFTIKQNPAPTCSVEWSGSICDGSPKTGGWNVPCNFKVKSTSGSNCSVVRDSSVTISVCEVYSNGYCSTPKLYTSSNYWIDSNNQYNLHCPTSYGSRRYRVEVYCFPNGGNSPRKIGSKEFYTR